MLLEAVLEKEGEDGKNHPVAYASCTLLKYEKNHRITKFKVRVRSCLGTQTFQGIYLLHHICVVVTDLCSVKGTSPVSDWQTRWLDGVRCFLSSVMKSSIVRVGNTIMHNYAVALSRAPLESMNTVLAFKTNANFIPNEYVNSETIQN